MTSDLYTIMKVIYIASYDILKYTVIMMDILYNYRKKIPIVLKIYIYWWPVTMVVHVESIYIIHFISLWNIYFKK